ncbi:hypothetical protein CFAM422_011294 [Trichoderma lentiforme]|uniref:Uncharacterized protein n=1 Tax=Trichoderma lentiforme TaxID=1567552 RepID=A0A9P4X6S5_9HYPO|nr:hypothetical protein CFAM422_011294 [Trichoderma lentiforme]
MTQSKSKAARAQKKMRGGLKRNRRMMRSAERRDRRSRIVGEKAIGRKKLVTSPGISGDTWAWASKILAAPANQSESAVPCSAVGTEALTCLLPD